MKTVLTSDHQRSRPSFLFWNLTCRFLCPGFSFGEIGLKQQQQEEEGEEEQVGQVLVAVAVPVAEQVQAEQVLGCEGIPALGGSLDFQVQVDTGHSNLGSER